MKRSILQTAVMAMLGVLSAGVAMADLQPATAALNAPTVNIGGTSDFEWGPIVSQGLMTLNGSADTHYPQKFAGGEIIAKGGSAGNNTYCANGPSSNLEYSCGLNPPPDYPHINFSDYRQLAILEGNSCGGQSCLNPPNPGGINDPVCTVNGLPKVYFFDGSPSFNGGGYFCGVLVTLDNAGTTTTSFNGGAGTITTTPPANAWMQYQVGTPAGGPDTVALNEYPGDSGFHSSSSLVTLTNVAFQGYIFTTNGFKAHGNVVILGSVQFGAGTSTSGGGATIYFSSQTVFVQPPPGQVDQPIIFPNSGCYTSGITVNIVDSDLAKGASIYYTTNGNIPDQNSTLYTGPIQVNSAETITAVAIMGGVASKPASTTYSFTGCTPPPTVTFTANPTSISLGGSSVLTWTTQNATSVSIDQGIGMVTPISGGNTTAFPTVTTIYTLTAIGPGGSATAKATVTVGGTIGTCGDNQCSGSETCSSCPQDCGVCPPPAQIQFNPTSYGVTEDAGVATIVVTRTGDSSGTSTVQFASADGTAKAGVDYTAVSGKLTFSPGMTIQTFDVPVINDRAVDGAETVNLSLSNPTGAGLGASQALLTITDQNPPPPPPPAPFISQLIPFSAPVNQILPFTLRVLGTGFDTTGAQVIWNGTANLTVLSRTTTEIDVTVDPSIWNNTIGPYPVIVRNPGPVDSNTATFTVEGVGANPPPSLTSLSPNTALAGSPSFTLTVNGENFESGAVVMWNGSNRTTTFGNITQLTAAISAADVASAGSANVNVRNPDNQVSNTLPFTITAVPVSQIQFNPTSYSVNEDAGLATITVTRTVDTSGTSTVQFASADGTAMAGKDYVGVSGTLTFNPGDASATFDVPVMNDRLVDGPETVNLSLTNPTGATLGVSQAVLTINDQNPAPPPPPAPFISELVPYTAPVGFASSFSMRVLGTGFDAAAAQVIWNGATSLPVVSRSTSEIDVTVDPAIWSNTAGSYPVLVRNPGPVDSNQASFTVRPLGSGNPPPFIVSGPTANPNPTYTKTTTLTAVGGTLTSGASFTYTWMLSGTNPSTGVSFTNNGTSAGTTSVATFPMAGTYHIFVRVTDTVTKFAVDSAAIDVVVIRNATSISVTPKDQTITINMPLNLTASIVDQWGVAMNLTPNWTSTAGSLAPSGLTASFSDSDASIQQAVVTAAVTNALGVPLSDSAKVTIVIAGAGAGDLNNAKAYPVPFKSNSGDPYIHFKSLPAGTRIRIFTITGHIVQTLDAPNGGNIDWNVTNANLDKLASGVYLYIMDGNGQKKEGKLVIIQ